MHVMNHDASCAGYGDWCNAMTAWTIKQSIYTAIKVVC